MSLSRAQQGLFRPLVEGAWKRHCKANAVEPKDKSAKDKWYRAELKESLGVESTSQCNKAADFDKLMAHFESLIGDSIYWAMKAFRGHAERILHALNAYCLGHNIDEDYLRRIARQALQTQCPPQLADMRSEDLLILLRAVKIHTRRRLSKDDPTLTPGPDAPEWAHLNYAEAKLKSREETETDEDPF